MSDSVNALAEKLGLSPDKIKVVVPNLTSLLKEGVVIELKIGRFRGKRKLMREDLGLEGMNNEDWAAFENEYLSLGSKLLLPVEVRREGDRTERRGRALLEECSFKTDQGRFVPVTAFLRWEQENALIHEEYLRLRDDLLERYDEIREQVLRDYERAAEKLYRRLASSLPALTTEQGFVENFVQRIADDYPSPGDIEMSWRYEENIFYFPLPSGMEREVLESERLRIDREALKQEEQTRLEVARRMGAEVARRSEAKREEIIDGFLKGVAGQLRSLVYDTVSSALGTFQRRGKFSEHAAERLGKMISRIKSLNFYGDADVEDQITKLETAIDRSMVGRSTGDVEAILEEAEVAARQLLIEIGEVPRQVRVAAKDQEIEVEGAEGGRRRSARADENQVSFDQTGEGLRRTRRAG